MFEIVFGAIAVALFFAVLYYRSQWLNTSAIGEAKDEKIEAIEVQYAEAQTEAQRADEETADEVKLHGTRGDAVDFLRDSLRKN